MDTVKFDKKATRVIAHRGLSGLEKENTNPAFVAAGNRSYYGIETDIHKTKDGHFVINHDGDFNRVAGENIIIEESTLEEIQKIVLFDVDGTKNRCDLRPTTLQNYISICKKYEKHSVIELKAKFTDEDIKEIISSAEAEIGEGGRLVVRPSGTEPLIRIMVEGEDESKSERIAIETAEKIKSRLKQY